MPFDTRVYTNGDTATIVWRPDTFVPDCRGFALYRQAAKEDGNGPLTPRDDGIAIHTWVGFANQPPAPSGTHKPSTEWPIQRYLWSDYGARDKGHVRYKVVPMVGSAGQLTEGEPKGQWTDWYAVRTGQTPQFQSFYNRGIVPAQWMARALAGAPNPTENLRNRLTVIGDHGPDRIRVFLGGELRSAMLNLLDEAQAEGQRVYAALYELNDPELIRCLVALGPRVSIILASGAYKAANKKKGTPAVPDENSEIREELRQHSLVQVIDRLVTSPHFAHDKFVVVCDDNDVPLKVWTGSTNWTVTGLCTQVNNGLLIEEPGLAACFKRQWDLLAKAGKSYPKWLAAEDSVPTHSAAGAVQVTAWFAPTSQGVDLADVRRLIQGARQGVLFLMFNPGKENTLLNDILALDREHLFVHGVINQDPDGADGPILKIVDRGTPLPASPQVILPRSLQGDLPRWRTESRYNAVMIHSKVIVIDPFGPHPVVMTGSHNLGPKASRSNDENLVIVENAPGLAAEYAVNVLGVYGHYKWRYNEWLAAGGGQEKTKGKKISPKWKGLEDKDAWQRRYMTGEHLREIDFWFGRLATATPEMTPHGPREGLAANPVVPEPKN